MEQAASITTRNLLGIGWLSETNLTENSDADWGKKVACGFEWRVPGGRPIMHQEEFGWPIFRAARKLGPGHLIPLGFGSSDGGLLWLTKNRSTTTSGLKKKWDRHSCLSRIYR